MKLKCYLRGLGLGILVTAALFLCAGAANKQSMTDEQIIKRAKELGMVDNQYLSDYIYPSTEEDISNAGEPETTSVEMGTTTEENTEATVEMEDTVEEESESIEETTTQELSQNEEIDPSQKFYVIVVNKGDGSDTVSRKVFETGLIPDAAEFDHYLMENGYDRRITTGNHEIPSNATIEQMAKILCSN